MTKSPKFQGESARPGNHGLSVLCTFLCKRCTPPVCSATVAQRKWLNCPTKLVWPDRPPGNKGVCCVVLMRLAEQQPAILEPYGHPWVTDPFDHLRGVARVCLYDSFKTVDIDTRMTFSETGSATAVARWPPNATTILAGASARRPLATGPRVRRGDPVAFCSQAGRHDRAEHPCGTTPEVLSKGAARSKPARRQPSITGMRKRWLLVMLCLLLLTPCGFVVYRHRRH